MKEPKICMFSSIPIPEAHKGNMEEFCVAWKWNYGGTDRNARRCWDVELRENEKQKKGLSDGTYSHNSDNFF